MGVGRRRAGEKECGVNRNTRNDCNAHCCRIVIFHQPARPRAVGLFVKKQRPGHAGYSPPKNFLNERKMLCGTVRFGSPSAPRSDSPMAPP